MGSTLSRLHRKGGEAWARRRAGRAAPPRRAPRVAGLAVGLALLVALAGPPGIAASGGGNAAASDAFAEGYATAVIERELGPSDAAVTARDGVLTIRLEHLSEEAREKLERRLSSLQGVRRVEFVDGGAPPEVAAGGAGAGAASEGLRILPPRELFDPLLADPRWPHFGAAYQRYAGDDELESVGGVSFGESVPLLGLAGPFEGRTQLGVQAGVFSIFDLDASSFDLVNSDFMVGVTGTWRREALSAMARIFHQSSHLGDEFLLRSRVDRVNLSYEQADLLLSYDLPYGLRPYAGGGVIVHAEPSELERPSLQAGLEWSSPETWAGGALRPLAALDVKSWAETGWDADLSLRAGFQLESPRLLGRRLQILLEYYDGRSPNGQFFERDVRWLGLGTHLHF